MRRTALRAGRAAGMPARAISRPAAPPLTTAQAHPTLVSSPLPLHPQPPTAGRRFVALAGFYVVHRFFGLPPTAGAGALRAAGRAFCAKAWGAVLSERPGELMLEDYCFRWGGL